MAIEFPRTTVGGVSLPRMLMGTNWLMGYSHRSYAADLGIRMIYSNLPPVCGAVCTAAELAGVEDIETFRSAIKHTFSERTI